MDDYESLYERFRLDSPARFNFCRDVFDGWAEDPAKIALVWVDDDGNEVRRTFAGLKDESARLCNVLSARGVRRGDVVVVILPRLIEWWVVNLACLRMGAVVCPGTTQLKAKDIAYRLQASEAVCVIAEDGVAAEIDAVVDGCPDVGVRILVGGSRPGWETYEEIVSAADEEFETVDSAADDPAILYFTSGTTGFPKMTLHTHVSYPLGHRITGEFWLDLGPDDLHWNVSDTGWAKAAWSSLFGPWNMGAAVFVHQSPRFDPQRTLEILSCFPITTLCAAPTIYRMLILENLGRWSFHSLRHCVAAGEPLNPEVIEVWKQATGIAIRDGYGQTESVLLVGSFPGLEERPGSMGKPAPGFVVCIIDDDGNEVPDDREGDIAVRVAPERPLGLFKEYWKDPERTAATHKGDWYLTGDRATRDPDGYLWFIGRADDVILSAGYRIGPFEVESALLEHEAVAESAVVSTPDEMRGELVKAFVVLAPGHEPSDELALELQEHTKAATAPYKYPRRIEFVDELPKTVSGKIKRAVLRARERAD
ncbi:MAG: AMP-binding protein [Acidobacteria bacterium]|nr:AMP-binding protein [Acidobacteriota bacterium]